MTLGVNTSKDMVLPTDSLLNFLSHYQSEGEAGLEVRRKKVCHAIYSLETLSQEACQLIDRHEPHPELRKLNLLSFEGFCRYLMDKVWTIGCIQ